MNESLRLFYALWPDDATRAALMDMQASLHGRKTSHRNLHLTLAFLGQQPADTLPVLKKILADLPQAALALTLDRSGYFTKKRIAWAGMHDTPDALTALHRDLVRRLKQEQVVFDEATEFRPHVTLARDCPPPGDLPFEPVRWQADHVALVESVTLPEGVSYRVLASRPGYGNALSPSPLPPF